MRRITMAGGILLLALTAGCGGSRGGSAAGGALGGAALGAGAYEFVAHREMQRIEDDLKAGRITQQEYEIRKDEIHRMSLLQ